MNKSLDLSGSFSLRTHCPPLSSLIGLAIMVAIASFIASNLVTAKSHIAVVWFANGITLGILLISPKRYWVAYLLTGFVANATVGILHGAAPALTLALNGANTVEILCAATIIYRPDRPAHHFTDRSSALRMMVAFLVAPAVSLILAGVARYYIVGTPIVQTMQVWYLAHGMGLAIETPLTLTVLFKDFTPLLKRRALVKTVGVLLLLGMATTFVFAQTQLPLLFFLFPFLALVVFQLGFPGMTVGLFIVSVGVSFFTLHGTGPFMLILDATEGQRILMAQFFILTCISMALPIAIALSERKRLERNLRTAQDQLRQLAATDQLTGIANRRMFDECLQREWKRAVRDQTPLCAIMIDIDCFKSYNDRYGHPAGDECLKAVAIGLTEVVRRPCDLVARYGGEEFVVLLPNTGLEGARFVAEQIRHRIELLQIVHAGTTDGRVTVSLGVETQLPSLECEAQSLVATADGLLYRAKHNGRNCVITNENVGSARAFAIAAAG